MLRLIKQVTCVSDDFRAGKSLALRLHVKDRNGMEEVEIELTR